MPDPTLPGAFRGFAHTQRSASPMYANLAAAVAERPDVLALLDGAPRAQRLPVMLFAAVHHEALADDRLFPATVDAFVDICRTHRAAIEALVAQRHVQTNEIGRAAALRAALTTLDPHVPITLVDVGASAGLNLLLDRYRYDYLGHGSVEARGDHPAVTIVCDTSRSGPVPTGPIPAIVGHVGVDPMPLDVTDDDDVRWLLACVWADDTARLDRLRSAVALARRHPPSMVRGDALTFTMPEPAPGGQVVVQHSWVAAYFDHDQQRAFEQRMIDAGVTWIWAEEPSWVPGLTRPAAITSVPGATALVITRPGGRPVRLAELQPHGRWMRWQ
jgi:hypothetical protein